MALIIDLDYTPYGIPFEGVYTKINMLRADKAGILLHVSCYASEQASKEGAQPVFDHTEFAPIEELRPGVNPLAIGYEWLKRQPNYSAGIDC